MSYRLKLILIVSVLIALTFSVGCTILFFSGEEPLNAETDRALENFGTVQNTLYLLNEQGTQTNVNALGAALGQMERRNMASWQGLTLSVAEYAVFESSPEVLADYTLPIPVGGQCCFTRVHDSFGHGLVVQSGMTAETVTLTLKARFDLSGVYAARDAQRNLYIKVYIAVVLFGVAASVVLSFSQTRQLRRLTAAVRKISGGDLSTRSRIRSADEFGQLSRDFDAMADKLQENIGRMETEIERQEAFMGAFAHELKTPMTSIIGFADLLRQGNLEESTRLMAAEYIYSEGHRLEKLSFKLLDLLLLKKDSVVMRRVWLSNYVHEIEMALNPVLKEKGIRLVCKADAKRVAFEPDLVKSLLYNLIDNAGKAMDNGGIIAVVGTAVPGGCRFQVADNGRGMEAADLTKITEAFYRVDKSRSRGQGSAGLGLALCKQIVELHGGSIRFESTPGKGTRVTVTLYGKVEKKHEAAKHS